jgi:hypothetical protein
MSCICQVCLVHNFECELCFLIHFWLQHHIVLNHVIGMPHWITHKHMKMEFRYPLYIRGVYTWYMPGIHRHRTYTWNIHGIYRLHTLSRFQMSTGFASESCHGSPGLGDGQGSAGSGYCPCKENFPFLWKQWKPWKGLTTLIMTWMFPGPWTNSGAIICLFLVFLVRTIV